MCHQWAPSVKRNGVWRDHHADFKAKEKEYRFYQEARRWEKLNWKKFLTPIPEKHSHAHPVILVADCRRSSFYSPISPELIRSFLSFPINTSENFLSFDREGDRKSRPQPND